MEIGEGVGGGAGEMGLSTRDPGVSQQSAAEREARRAGGGGWKRERRRSEQK